MRRTNKMNSKEMNRREFIRKAGAGAIGLAALATTCCAEAKVDSKKKSKDDKQNLVPSDHGLEAQIEKYVKNLRKKGKIPSTETTSFYVYDITDKKVLTDINIDDQKMGASLPKLFAMAAAYDKLERKKAGSKERKRVRKHIEKMIQPSDNAEFNWVVKYVGGVKAVQKYVDSTGMFTETKIVETINTYNGRTYKNKTSAHDLNIFLNQVYLGNIVSKKASKEMLEIMDGYTTSRIAQRILPMKGVKNLAGKTGVVYGMNGESTIITFKKKGEKERKFIFTAIFEDTTLPYKKGHGRATRKRWGRVRSGYMRDIAEIVVKYYQENT
jgi:beta-lactamase class A